MIPDVEAIKPNKILDLDPSVGQVRFTLQYEILNVRGEPIGYTQPSRGTSPSITHRSTASVMRMLRGFRVDGSDANEVDPYSNRIRPSILLEDGTKWRQGVYLFSQPERLVGSWHTPMAATLLDLGFILDQESPRSWGLGSRGIITDVMTKIVEAAGIIDFVIQPSTQRIGSPIFYSPGTSYRWMLDRLSELAGYHRPYFDNNGTLRCRQIDELRDGPNVHDYRLDREGGSRVLRNPPPLEAPAVDAPGGHLVINTGASRGEIKALVYVDPNLEFSKERRGFLILKTHEIQGIETTEQAKRMGRMFAAQTPQSLVSFSSMQDPRHDVFAMVRYGPDSGRLYRETAYTLPLTPGFDMTHELSLGTVTED